jgi:hypothetical protein
MGSLGEMSQEGRLGQGAPEPFPVFHAAGLRREMAELIFAAGRHGHRVPDTIELVILG